MAWSRTTKSSPQKPLSRLLPKAKKLQKSAARATPACTQKRKLMGRVGPRAACGNPRPADPSAAHGSGGPRGSQGNSLPPPPRRSRGSLAAGARGPASVLARRPAEEGGRCPEPRPSALLDRNAEAERRSLAENALHLDRPAVQFDQVVHQVEAEPDTAVPARGGAVHLHELLEDQLVVFGSDADALVANC